MRPENAPRYQNTAIAHFSPEPETASDRLQEALQVLTGVRSRMPDNHELNSAQLLAMVKLLPGYAQEARSFAADFRALHLGVDAIDSLSRHDCYRGLEMMTALEAMCAVLKIPPPRSLDELISPEVGAHRRPELVAPVLHAHALCMLHAGKVRGDVLDHGQPIAFCRKAIDLYDSAASSCPDDLVLAGDGTPAPLRIELLLQLSGAEESMRWARDSTTQRLSAHRENCNADGALRILRAVPEDLDLNELTEAFLEIPEIFHSKHDRKLLVPRLDEAIEVMRKSAAINPEERIALAQLLVRRFTASPSDSTGKEGIASEVRTLCGSIVLAETVVRQADKLGQLAADLSACGLTAESRSLLIRAIDQIELRIPDETADTAGALIEAADALSKPMMQLGGECWARLAALAPALENFVLKWYDNIEKVEGSGATLNVARSLLDVRKYPEAGRTVSLSWSLLTELPENFRPLELVLDILRTKMVVLPHLGEYEEVERVRNLLTRLDQKTSRHRWYGR